MASTITGASVRAERQALPEPRSARRLGADRRRAWAAERGAVVWEATAEVVGGFPGYVGRGGRLQGAKVRLTERYLLVDEGRPHGFGIPLAWLLRAHAAAPSDRATGEPPLRLAYADGVVTRWFTLRLRPSGLLRRRGGCVAGALETLRAAGVPDRADPSSPLPPAAPNLAVSWDDSRRFAHENVIWSGQAAAPLAVGAETAAASVWLTTRSLIWSAATGPGVNRLPLDLVRNIVSAQLDDRAGTPVAVVAVGADSGDLHQILFRFDHHASADRNLRERGAFVVGLRSRGIPLGAPAPLLQPWRPQTAAPPPAPARSPHGNARDATASTPPPPSAPVPLGSWTPAPQETAPEPVPAASPSTDLAVVAGQLVQPIEAVASPANDAPPAPFVAGWPTLAAPPDDPAVPAASHPITPPAPAGPPSALARDLPHTRACEAAALTSLATVLRAIDDPEGPAPSSPPSPLPTARHADALAELDAATASGTITTEEAATRRARLLALIDAAPRLRTLLELRDAGHLSDADLAAKRAAILAPLAHEVFGPGD